MTPRRALSYVAVWLLLTVVWWVTEPAEPKQSVAPSATVERSPFADVSVTAITAVEIEQSDRRVRAVRSNDGWRVVEPPGVSVSGDLIAALVSAVVEVEEPEVVAAPTGDDEEFGLHDPRIRLTFERRGETPVRIVLGNRNPAQTAVYGRREGRSEIVLLGLNVRYYVDLAMRAVAPGDG